jgi:hypothetical protein
VRLLATVSISLLKIVLTKLGNFYEVQKNSSDHPSTINRNKILASKMGRECVNCKFRIFGYQSEKLSLKVGTK